MSSKRPLVYGIVNDNLVLLPEDVAKALVAEHQAIWSLKTYGEARRLQPRSLNGVPGLDEDDYDIPADEDPYNAALTNEYLNGDWPSPAATIALDEPHGALKVLDSAKVQVSTPCATLCGSRNLAQNGDAADERRLLVDDAGGETYARFAGAISRRPPSRLRRQMGVASQGSRGDTRGNGSKACAGPTQPSISIRECRRRFLAVTNLVLGVLLLFAACGGMSSPAEAASPAHTPTLSPPTTTKTDTEDAFCNDAVTLNGIDFFDVTPSQAVPYYQKMKRTTLSQAVLYLKQMAQYARSWGEANGANSHDATTWASDLHLIATGNEGRVDKSALAGAIRQIESTIQAALCDDDGTYVFHYGRSGSSNSPPSQVVKTCVKYLNSKGGSLSPAPGQNAQSTCQCFFAQMISVAEGQGIAGLVVPKGGGKPTSSQLLKTFNNAKQNPDGFDLVATDCGQTGNSGNSGNTGNSGNSGNTGNSGNS